MTTTNLNESNFDSVINRPGIVFVDFWATWCGPCRAFAPVYEKVAAAHPDITFGKVDTEENRGLQARFGVRSIPTLMIFRDGVLLYSQPGMVPARALEELVKQARDVDMAEVRRQVAAERTAAAHA